MMGEDQSTQKRGSEYIHGTSRRETFRPTRAAAAAVCVFDFNLAAVAKMEGKWLIWAIGEGSHSTAVWLGRRHGGNCASFL